jgi:hypothetical protein
MWLWESELRELGFRRKSERYWQCERHYGLQVGDHLSVYTWSEQPISSKSTDQARILVELSAFHVTFAVRGENVHFYYHELLDNEWEPAGHTSSAEIRRVGCDPQELRDLADAVAVAFVQALHGVYHGR